MSDYDMSIHHNPDGMAWAKFFVETTKDMELEAFRDESYMVTWFSNAMMAMSGKGFPNTRSGGRPATVATAAAMAPAPGCKPSGTG